MNLNDFYTERTRQFKLVDELNAKRKEVEELMTELNSNILVTPCLELWHELFKDGEPLRSDRIITPLPFSPKSRDHKIAVGRTLGILYGWSSNVRYLNLDPHPSNLDVATNLIRLLHDHGTQLAPYISTHNLKQAKFLALVDSIKKHNIYDHFKPTTAESRGFKIYRKLTNFLYYEYESDTPITDEYDITGLTVELRSDNTWKITSYPQDSTVDYYTYKCNIHLHQLHSELMPMFNTLKLELNTKLQTHQQSLKLIDLVRDDLSKYLLLNSI